MFSILYCVLYRALMIITDFVSRMWLGAQGPNTAFGSWAHGSTLKPILACFVMRASCQEDTWYHWIAIESVYA